MAIADAQGIFRFLQKRGYIQGYDDKSTAPLLLREASPLTGVDMVEVGKVLTLIHCINNAIIGSENPAHFSSIFHKPSNLTLI